MTQHAGLTEEEWTRHGRDRQILMIANEMNRAGKLGRPDDTGRRRNAYARVLRLADLTAAVDGSRSLRRELLRWREVVAELYLQDALDEAAHRRALEVLLLFTPEAARQRPFLLRSPAAAPGPTPAAP